MCHVIMSSSHLVKEDNCVLAGAYFCKWTIQVARRFLIGTSRRLYKSRILIYGQVSRILPLLPSTEGELQTSATVVLVIEFKIISLVPSRVGAATI